MAETSHAIGETAPLALIEKGFSSQATAFRDGMSIAPAGNHIRGARAMGAAGRTVQSENFILLDGLRGLGALLVLYGHSYFFWGDLYVPSAAMVVDLFFLLSGFVIAYSYEPKLLSGAMGVRGFMLQRAVRLYPLYILGIVLGYLAHLVMVFGDANAEARMLVYTRDLAINLTGAPSSSPYSNSLYDLNGPAWTLFFEMGVNLVYVLAFRWLRDTRVLALIVVLLFSGLAFAVIQAGVINIGAYWPTWWAGYLRAGFGFFAGVLAYRLLGSPRTARRPESRWSLVLLGAVVLVAFIPASPGLRPFVDIGLVLLLGIPILWLGPSIAPPAKLARLCLIGGRLSYAIYILHFPFLQLMERVTWRFPQIQSLEPLHGILLAAVTVGVAFLAEKYYDRPLRRFIGTKLRERSTRKKVSQSERPVAAAE
jgi:peptidoglycan/LPS O-acetylase OafA/YrhL